MKEFRRWFVVLAGVASLWGALGPAAGISAADGSTSKVTLVPCRVGGPGGLIAAIKAANRKGSGVLQLAKRCTYTLTRADNKTRGSDGFLEGNGLPVLRGRITLVGQAGTTLARARNAPNFRIILVAEHANVSITYITITGGKLTTKGAQGGGISNEGTITSLSHDTIRNNVLRIGFGAGIYNNGKIVNLSHDRISANRAGNPDGNGGGVFNGKKIITATNDAISGNQAGSAAGILNNGSLNLSHSLVSNNHLTGNGAGGGIANSFGLLNLSHDTISGNTATGGPQASGGGIDSSGKTTITNSVVKDNVARGVGGGLRDEGQEFRQFTFTVIRTTVIHNTVTSSKGPATGGGIYNAGGMSLFSTVVRQNMATTQTGRAVGAGIYNDRSLTLTTTSITANVVKDPGGAAVGGGLYVDEDSKKTALQTTTITGNRAVGAQARGGGILFAGGAPVTLRASSVRANRPGNCYPSGSVAGCTG